MSPGPLAQRRQADGEDGEAMIEVFAQPPLGHLLGEVAVGGGHQADIDLDGAGAADPLEAALLEHPEELGLERGVELGDLVEEQGAAVGQLEPPPGARRSRR